MRSDIMPIESDKQTGEPLIQPVMRSGRQLALGKLFTRARQRAANQLARLPEHLRQLREEPPYPVSISQPLKELAREADQQIS